MRVLKRALLTGCTMMGSNQRDGLAHSGDVAHPAEPLSQSPLSVSSNAHTPSWPSHAKARTFPFLAPGRMRARRGLLFFSHLSSLRFTAIDLNLSLYLCWASLSEEVLVRAVAILLPELLLLCSFAVFRRLSLQRLVAGVDNWNCCGLGKGGSY
jgi:hypothetical protein